MSLVVIGTLLFVLIRAIVIIADVSEVIHAVSAFFRR